MNIAFFVSFINRKQGLRHRGGRGDVPPPQYFKFLALCLWVLHGKNRIQTAFVPPQPSGRDGALDRTVQT